MSLTKGIHTHIVKTTLDFCDKEKIEFRDFLSERLLDEDDDGDSYKWMESVNSPEDPGQRNRVTGQIIGLWEYLQFYYDRSEGTVTPKTDNWSQGDWNLAANEIYRYKFLDDGDADSRAEEWVSLFNSSPLIEEERLVATAEARVVDAEARAVDAEARAAAVESWCSARAARIEEVVGDLSAIGQLYKSS